MSKQGEYVTSAAIIDADACDRHNRHYGYAGDISPTDAWNLLANKAEAVLVDVRTPQEWEQIGLPELAELGTLLHPLTWNMESPAEASAQFVSGFSRLQVAQDTPVLLICRSGGRSQPAAMALTAAGYTRCFNIAGGFEGPMGWKNSQLPWTR